MICRAETVELAVPSRRSPHRTCSKPVLPRLQGIAPPGTCTPEHDIRGALLSRCIGTAPRCGGEDAGAGRGQPIDSHDMSAVGDVLDAVSLKLDTTGSAEVGTNPEGPPAESIEVERIVIHQGRNKRAGIGIE